MPIVTAQRADMCYCPGCSHGMVLENLGRALDGLGLSPDKVCLVSDIGCIGTADRYFACHTFHGLHGRSITYAEGIQRTRPDLLVVVLMGDGGCGIGTAHLVHAARRNANIKVIVCNNFNFGMTGGQHSPTTPCQALTTTTRQGAHEHPFDVCATVAANGAALVARYNSFDVQAVDRFAAALRTSGFVLLDVWELCTAYFVPANHLNRGSLDELSHRLNMPFGVLHERPQPPSQDQSEPRALARADAPVHGAPRPPSEPLEQLPWTGRSEIVVAGSAGQRIRSAVGVIGEIAVAGGLFAAQQDDFPITVRKGFSVSQLVLAGEPILYGGVDRPDVVVVLSEDGLRRLGGVGAFHAACTLVADRQLGLNGAQPRVHAVDVAVLEKQVGKASAALAALAAALRTAGLIDAARWLPLGEAALSGPYRDANLRAIAHGLELGDTLLALSGAAAPDEEVYHVS